MSLVHHFRHISISETFCGHWSYFSCIEELLLDLRIKIKLRCPCICVMQPLISENSFVHLHMVLFMIVDSFLHDDPDVTMKLCFGDWLVMGSNMETVLLHILCSKWGFLTHIKENNKYTPLWNNFTEIVSDFSQ